LTFSDHLLENTHDVLVKLQFFTCVLHSVY